MSEWLHLVYTHNLHGSMDLLPRLYTFLDTLRQETPASRFLLIDAGESCAGGVWHCAATGGRSMLLVFDAMGYHAASANHLSAQDRQKLQANLMQMGLVGSAHEWRADGLRVTYDAGQEDRLTIILPAAQQTTLHGSRLSLAALDTGQVGSVVVEMSAPPRCTQQRILPIPPGAPPNPTIAGTVEFVLGEARHFQRKHDR